MIPTQHSSTQPLCHLLLLLFCIILFSGCVHEIGDACTTSGDCPSGAICDSTAPEGYCMVKSCTPNSCSDEALCISFDHLTSYCLRRCENDDDCGREGYVCRADKDGSRFCYIPE